MMPERKALARNGLGGAAPQEADTCPTERREKNGSTAAAAATGSFSIRFPSILRRQVIQDLNRLTGEPPDRQTPLAAAPAIARFIHSIHTHRAEDLRRSHVADRPGLLTDVVDRDLIEAFLPKQPDRGSRDRSASGQAHRAGRERPDPERAGAGADETLPRVLRGITAPFAAARAESRLPLKK